MTEPTKQSPRARYWRSLDELQQTPDFEQYLDREFPVAASEFPEGVSRRRWLQLMGASLAMGGVVGCRYPEESIAPFVIRPEGRVPGESYSRATNFELAGRVYNLLISCVDGRPLKIEGNPEHPTGQGATDTFSQASILGLYDPDRKAGVSRRVDGELTESTWSDFESYGRALVETYRSTEGQGFGVLVEPTASPSLVRMLERLREALPEMTICQYDSVRGDVMRQATQSAIGRVGEPLYDLDKARVVLSVQSDLLGHDVGFIRNARTFAEGRQPLEGEMSRLYMVEAGYSNTGACADSRLALRPSEMIAFLAELERRIDDGEASERAAGEAEEPYDQLNAQQRLDRFLDVVAAELRDAEGEALVVVGEQLGADAVAAGIRINNKLGALGETVRFAEPVDASLEAVSLQEFVDQAQSGALSGLLLLGGNPVFTAPSNVDVAGAIRRARDTVYWGDYEDETAVLCDWVLPAAHALESWGDVIGPEGFYGVSQPQILPLLDGRSALEVIAGILDDPETDGESIVRRTTDAVAGSSLSNREWRKLLHDGFDESIKVDLPATTYSGDDEPLTDAEPQPWVTVDDIDHNDIEILFVPSDGIYDGRFANNGWLQEMPHTLTKLTWDNAAVMSPLTAEALKVEHGKTVALRRGETTIELPVYEMPGMSHGTVSVAFGYGRERAGMVGGFVELGVDPVGIDVRPLRTSDSMLVAYQMESRPRPQEYLLATTQDHWAIDVGGREETEDRSHRLVREGTMELLEKVPGFAEEKGPHVPDLEKTQLWREPMEEFMEPSDEKRALPQWGMVIDLTKCIGCNACVIACQSENNVPIVGKEQVANSREMHWLRIDRYFQGDAENAEAVREPMLCMHCETAPCEQVCPVAATVHTEEGINAMAYNRCIGTRYCANNCPFKVRRFNFFNFNEEVGVGYGIDAFPGTIETANRKLQQLVLNPEVTVRGRGVMEKCTYCIQRVEKAKIEARKDGGRAIRDGDVQTACQTACPTRAIEFGNIQDPEARVAQLRNNDPRNYGMLPQLKIKPRTTYLARIRNPHPRLMTLAQIDDLAHFTQPHGGHGEGEPGDDNHHDEHAVSASKETKA